MAEPKPAISSLEADPESPAFENTPTSDIRDGIVHFGGPEDTFNPKNWTVRSKWGIIWFTCSMTFLISLISTIIAPSGPAILASFHTSSDILSTLVVTIFLLGYALGPFLLSPLSEICGRLPIYYICSVAFLICTILCAAAKNLGMLIAFRFLAGASGSFIWTVVPGIVADLFVQSQRGLPMAVWATGLTVSPVVGPIIGGFMTERVGWRWEFWIICIASGLILISQIPTIREIYPPILLHRKTLHLRQLTSNPSLQPSIPIKTAPLEILRTAATRPFSIARQPIVFFLSLYNALIFGVLYLLLTHVPVIFQATYGWTLEISSLAYIALGIGFGVDLIAYGALSDRLLQQQAKKRVGGKLRPEDRLTPMIVAGPLAPVGLLVYGWSIQYGVFWVVPMVGLLVIGLGMLPVFTTSPSYLIDAFPLFADAANTTLTLMRSLVGTFLPLAGPAMYGNLGEGWANTLLAFVALVFVPAPWVFWKYGEKIREKGGWMEEMEVGEGE